MAEPTGRAQAPAEAPAAAKVELEALERPPRRATVGRAALVKQTRSQGQALAMPVVAVVVRDITGLMEPREVPQAVVVRVLSLAIKEPREPLTPAEAPAAAEGTRARVIQAARALSSL